MFFFLSIQRDVCIIRIHTQEHFRAIHYLLIIVAEIVGLQLRIENCATCVDNKREIHDVSSYPHFSNGILVDVPSRFLPRSSFIHKFIISK